MIVRPRPSAFGLLPILAQANDFGGLLRQGKST